VLCAAQKDNRKSAEVTLPMTAQSVKIAAIDLIHDAAHNLNTSAVGTPKTAVRNEKNTAVDSIKDAVQNLINLTALTVHQNAAVYIIKGAVHIVQKTAEGNSTGTVPNGIMNAAISIQNSAQQLVKDTSSYVNSSCHKNAVSKNFFLIIQ